jgi:branched-chain amino acid transport system substrate-binding protein
MKEYKSAIRKYSRLNPEDPFGVFDWGAAQTLVEALKNMDEPTPEALMDSVRNLDVKIPMLLPGIEVKTSGTKDGYPIEATQIQRFEGENWELQGEVIQAPH